MNSSPVEDAQPGPAPRPQPTSLTDLFVSFTLLALQGFGGVLAVVQRELVDKKQWMTREEFVEEWSVAQVMPGPNVINMAVVIGMRYFGLRGAAMAVAGLLTMPLLVVITLAMVYAQFAGNPHVANALRVMGAVAAGLIGATGVKVIPALRNHPLGFGLSALVAALAFIAVALLRLPLLGVLLGLGGISCFLTWRKLS
jgi:chromate transporter